MHWYDLPGTLFSIALFPSIWALFVFNGHGWWRHIVGALIGIIPAFIAFGIVVVNSDSGPAPAIFISVISAYFLYKWSSHPRYKIHKAKYNNKLRQEWANLKQGIIDGYNGDETGTNQLIDLKVNLDDGETIIVWRGKPQAIEFKYINAKDEDSIRHVDVKAIYEGRKGQIYMHGYCHQRNEDRTFRFDRIQGRVTDLTTGEILDKFQWIGNLRTASEI